MESTRNASLLSSNFTWKSVDRIRAMTKMKIVLKGLRTAEDAKLAVDHGVDGIHRFEPWWAFGRDGARHD